MNIHSYLPNKPLSNILSYSLFVLFVAMALVIMMPSAADAAVFRQGNRIVIEEGETINDDLYVAGSTIQINGTVNGDLIAAGNSITVDGNVTGSTFLAGSDVGISGRIGNSARVASGNLSVHGDIGRDLIAGAGTVDVQRNSNIRRDFVGGSSDARMDGQIGRNVIGSMEKLQINGTVNGTVKVDVSNLTVGSGARIGGDLRYKSANEAQIANGADIEGDVDMTRVEKRRGRRPAVLYIGAALFSLLWLLALGVALFLLFPRFGNDFNRTLESKPWVSLGWGFLILILTPFAFLILLITVIGVPIAFVLLFLYIVAIYVTKIYVGYFVGSRIFAALGKVTHWFWPLFVGLLVVVILSAIPFIGWLSRLAIVLFGLGALILTLTDYHRESKQNQPAA